MTDAAAKLPELKPCPFCGGPRDALAMGMWMEVVFVRCMACDGHGPSVSTTREAMGAWNRRVEPQAERVQPSVAQPRRCFGRNCPGCLNCQ